MAIITEITLGYSRKNETKQYNNEVPTSFLKFTLESQDQNKKAVDSLIDYGLGILTRKIDQWSYDGAIVLSRTITVKDQDGRSLQVPDKYKNTKDEAGGGAQGDASTETPHGDAKEPPAPSSKKLSHKQAQEQIELMDIYGDDKAPIMDIDVMDGKVLYRCPNIVPSGEDQEDICNMAMVDNRGFIKANKYKSNSPHFKCPTCDHPIWPKKKTRG